VTDEAARLKSVWRHAASSNFAEGWSAGELALRLRGGSDANDDCAILDVEGNGSLVIGSDYIRGVKFTLFELGHLGFHDVGWYLAMANFSDVAAMGATPVGLLTVIRYPREMTEGDFDEVLAGIAEACRAVGANPLGGDVGSAERLFLSGAAFGICEKDRVLRRDGARAGDLLVLTGPVGTPAAALVYFDHCKSNGDQLSRELEDELLQSWRRPIARVGEGRMLAELGAHACQDVSDGFRDTVEQLCRASGVGCRVAADSLPIEDSVCAVADLAGLDPVALALSASVDFELAGAIAPEDVDRCRERFEAAGRELHLVGEFTAEEDLILLSEGGGHPLPGTSWDHMTDDPAAVTIKATQRR
jgi:thiamine-monophosphate kinase